MKIKKSELVEFCRDLIKRGYTRCKDDPGYEQGKSIQEFMDAKYSVELTKSEIRGWFKNIPELKGIRIQKTDTVFQIEDDEEEVVSSQTTAQPLVNTVNNEMI